MLSDIQLMHDVGLRLHTFVNRSIEDASFDRQADEGGDDFRRRLCHDLRTPLNAIIGYSEMLTEDAQDRGDEDALQDLEKIQGAGKHLLGLINDILDLSKIEAGKMELYLERVSLPAMVDDVKMLVEPLIEKNGNTLEIQCPADIDAIRTDVTKLKQCASTS